MTWLVQYGQGREVREKVRNAAADVLAGGRLSELAEKTLRGFDRAFARSFGIAVKYEDAPTIFEGRLCQEDAQASCCTRDEGGPFEVAL